MEQQINLNLLKQMVQFNKTAFDNTFSALVMAREQNEKMLNSFMENASWIPEEGKKSIDEWLAAYRKGCDDFKTMVDDAYGKVESFLNSPK